MILHSNHYDFNDDLIEFSSKLWYNIAEEALEISK